MCEIRTMTESIEDAKFTFDTPKADADHANKKRINKVQSNLADI